MASYRNVPWSCACEYNAGMILKVRSVVVHTGLETRKTYFGDEDMYLVDIAGVAGNTHTCDKDGNSKSISVSVAHIRTSYSNADYIK